MPLSLNCPACGEVVTAEGEEDLVVAAQSHARAHDGPEPSRDDILARSSGADLPRGWRLVTDAAAEALWFNGALMVVRAGTETTGGKLSIIELTENPGGFTPVHAGDTDQIFVILEGVKEFALGDDRVSVAAGGTMVVPAGLPFAHRCLASPTRSLFINAPAGIEPFFRAAGEPAPSRTVPPESHPRPDIPTFMAASALGGVDIVGPPPAS